MRKSEWEKCFRDVKDPQADRYKCLDCFGKGFVVLFVTCDPCQRCEGSGVLFEDDCDVEEEFDIQKTLEGI